MTTIAELLAVHNYRVTQPRREVFGLLESTHEPLPMHDIVSQLRHINRASIYRTLELFERLNIITVVHVGWKKRYELGSGYQKHHHHHLVCTHCGNITEINSERLEDVIYTLTGAHGFTPTGHTFEITGICMQCSQ